MIKEVYARYPERIAAARKAVNKPLTLAEKILYLKDNEDLQKKIAENGFNLYKEKLNPKVLGKEFLDIIYSKITKSLNLLLLFLRNGFRSSLN